MIKYCLLSNVLTKILFKLGPQYKTLGGFILTLKTDTTKSVQLSANVAVVDGDNTGGVVLS